MILTFLMGVYALFSYCQQQDISAMYGRFWSPYKYKDYGTGFRNAPESNYNFYPSVLVNKYYGRRTSFELGLQLTVYQQYYSTRKYWGAFSSSNIAGHIGLKACYSLVKSRKFETRIKGGVSIGGAGIYKWEYEVVAYLPSVDSVTRGIEHKDFTPVFPMLTTGIDVSYKIAKRLKLSLAANYQKGFIKITEYDIYYNDGSGSNDQRAKQWGAGDFYGLQIGLRYVLKDKKGDKTGSNKN